MGESDWSPTLVLFDLDGTLIESAPDIATSVNILLGEEGHEALSLPQVRSMIGNGIRKLVERAFAARDVTLEEAGLDSLTERMMAIYGEHLTVATHLMPGADAILRYYHGRGVKLGVVTNKPEGPTRRILDHFGYTDMLDVIIGGDSGPPRKPAPDMLLHAVDQARGTVLGSLMVGDSPADISAARAAGMVNVAVRGGYTNIPVEDLGADLVVDSLSDIPQRIPVR